jgi:hypothetical protein
LKSLITPALVYILPDSDLPFRFEADTSSFATSTDFSQQSQEDNKWHPVTFLFKSLSLVEHNYKIHDTEMLTIICGPEEWCHYLEGHHLIEIWTNHKNLKYFHITQKLN